MACIRHIFMKEKMNEEVISKFFRLANKAYKQVVCNSIYCYGHYAEKDDLIDECWATQHWLGYLEYPDFYIVRIMRWDMIQYITRQIPKCNRKIFHQLDIMDVNLTIRKYPFDMLDEIMTALRKRFSVKRYHGNTNMYDYVTFMFNRSNYVKRRKQC